ncbi:MurR/RpiR family transcriptional regulator [Enterococcus gallinarum]|uniref:MurR/RpiR family transcriptional regulator n=1 Tax=Enterococcus gallinarum TaxID=1353 RepID=UPI001CAA772F|nr:MurR/RpiR family transcriptional regulator [Enterococcus gallinarum]MDT2695802.1 MurR/RpiR family transcriptional regulator [Enterococcus gallinarum]
MGPLIIRLLTVLNNETTSSTYYHIAQTLLNNYSIIDKSSISDIATLCTVSKSTISKFARSIGFEDYYELKKSSTFAENKYHFDLNYISNIINPIEKNGYDDYLDAIIKDISAFKQQSNMRSIDALAKCLTTYNKVGAFGLLFSESAAIDFQYKLAYAGKFIITYQSDLKQIEFIEQADEETLLIIFSNSGGFLQRQQLRDDIPYRNVFENTKAKIFVITANEEVRNYRFVHDVILFPHETIFQTHSFIYQIIMDIIVSKYRQYLEPPTISPKQ